MIKIRDFQFFSAAVAAEIMRMVAEMAASLPETANPADFGGILRGRRWEFPGGAAVVPPRGSAPSPAPIYYILTFPGEGKEVWIAGYWAGDFDVGEETCPQPVSKRRLGRLSRPTARAERLAGLFNFWDTVSHMGAILFFRDELISALEAELARIRGLPED